MPVILVVDDSKTDRVLIGELLRQQEMDWLVEFANSAEQAMVTLTNLAVDVVITDMVMPEASGMDLLSYVHKQVQPVPVVMVSGRGNDSIAAEAIRNGAASYVSKDDLATRLVETVRQVLDARKSSPSYERLFGAVKNLQIQLELENDPTLLPTVVGGIQQAAFDMALIDAESRIRLGIALDEALINAMYHGNLELPAEDLVNVRTQLRNGERVALIEERRSVKPYSERVIHVEASFCPEKLEVAIRDEGSGFSRFFAADEENRGMTLIKNIMDKVAFNESGNEIRLVKMKEKAESPAEPLQLDS